VDEDIEEHEELDQGKRKIEMLPEESVTPMPLAFSPDIAFMEMSWNLLSGCPEFREILRSDLRVDRFFPKKWIGIQGFPPLDLQIKEDFPAFHKVILRPINPGCTCTRRGSSSDSQPTCIDILTHHGRHR